MTLCQVIAIGYAVMTTRTLMLDWKMRALRVLPIFVLPALAWILYSGIHSLTGICERMDQRSLERLREERQAKIDELKDRTNYYNTQQLIQRYDPDPAAKAAAASVLASKLGADSGLHFLVDESSHLNQHDMGKSSDYEYMQSGGLRRRNQTEARSPGSMQDGGFQYDGTEVSDIAMPAEFVVDHQSPVAMSPQDSGWMARLAALLVGEDPTQSYALICGNCHMHNGLVRKEDFLVYTYYCPHCHALNKPRNMDETSTCTSSPNMRTLMPHQLVLSKSEFPSGANSPDKSSPTNHHRLNRPKISGENRSDISIPSRKSSPKNRHRVNEPKALDENRTDVNVPDMKSSTTVVNANLVKESSESVNEKKNTVAEDPDNQSLT
ncbi:uncharacterized protein At2g24330-like [Bidens hawaiensis]|uniref:uncharacterized protein At2g24330-like n=1 Tax=Bidens hawaiensis TaxID=980011 RepID=UPI00404A0198